MQKEHAMSVTIDREPLAVRELGLSTLGQVLAHVSREDRLVVQVLIDGQEPDIEQFGTVRATPIDGRTIFIETANSAELAISVLDEVVDQLTAPSNPNRMPPSFCNKARRVKPC